MNEESCKICFNKNAKYNCPRCNILYCSVQCYKSQQHLECSEGFYRENVVEELALQKAEADASKSTKSMLEILQRIEQTDAQLDEESDSEGAASDPEGDGEELDSDDEAQADELANRLHGIDLDNAAEVWDRLTSAEKEEFQRFIDNGDIAKMLPEPTIWWAQEYKVDLVQPAEVRSQQEAKLLEACPKVVTNIQKLSNILPNAPSPAVRHNIANVLAAYTFVYRYFLGDVHENALETVDCLLSVCLNLKSSTVFDTEQMAVTSVIGECCNQQLPTDKETAAVLRSDVQTLFAGPKGCGKQYRRLFLLSALSDIRQLLTHAKRELREVDSIAKEKATTGSSSAMNVDVPDLKHVDGQLLKNCIKKIDFYLAYARSQYL
uniref:HIT-type domain-containing protein n=1 Tax=Anopheles melas TaxID=34690 RepID=A0A182TCY5_9DIPT